ncbi:hypothetical protein M3Y97_00051200 [Aphelenchoides bicaudatus]|nr:hypothetical protein M3Y97_00051200 [Aphelenchoides bicaudatus]
MRPCEASEASPSNEFLIGDEQPLSEYTNRTKRKSRTRNQSSAQFFRSMPNLQRLLQIQFLLFLSTFTSAAGIGCFVCSSFNKSNQDCEDPFNSTIAHPSASTTNNYQFPCWAFRQGRKGLFPADHCIKVSGYQLENPSQTIVIRTCALDSGSLTADTEIVRISHCGHFKYEGVHYSGCVQSCSTDGCNSAVRLQSAGQYGLIGFLLLFVGGRLFFT